MKCSHCSFETITFYIKLFSIRDSRSINW
uniref:Uncharacterized protein n=1 Tax=Anguilla anguilla TaxID=7936 RepID=A0A0E9TD06_ANGAN